MLCNQMPTEQKCSLEALEPCPFCGSDNLVLDNLTDQRTWFVSCDDCEIQQIAAYKKHEAIARWNMRSPTNPTAQNRAN